MRDKDLIAAFAEYRAFHDLDGLTVERWPDEENRKSTDIDAIAGHLAIEHTSVDTIEDQRRDGAWFKRVADPLERQFESLPFRLEIVFPYDGVRQGQSWDQVAGAIAAWIQRQSPLVSDGRHEVWSNSGRFGLTCSTA